MHHRLITYLAVLLLTVTSAATGFAQTPLKVEKLTDGSVPAEIVPDTRAVAENGIPDGRIAVAKTGDIAEAWYTQPTGIYRHGALGDTIEARALTIKTRRGRITTYRLNPTQVFEDLTPRIVDLDGDGRNEVVTIRASIVKGAGVTVYALKGDTLAEKASTPFIGTPNRWLNIAGIADFTGSRNLEIAFVDRPHIRGEVKFLSVDNRNRVILVAGLGGYTNHINGDTEQRLSAVIDFDGNGKADLVLPTFDRKSVHVLSLVRNRVVVLATAKLPGKLDKPISARVKDGKAQILVGLEDGSVYTLTK